LLKFEIIHLAKERKMKYSPMGPYDDLATMITKLEGLANNLNLIKIEYRQNQGTRNNVKRRLYNDDSCLILNEKIKELIRCIKQLPNQSDFELDSKRVLLQTYKALLAPGICNHKLHKITAEVSGHGREWAKIGIILGIIVGLLLFILPGYLLLLCMQGNWSSLSQSGLSLAADNIYYGIEESCGNDPELCNGGIKFFKQNPEDFYQAMEAKKVTLLANSCISLT
jgi:hypothetical protein